MTRFLSKFSEFSKFSFFSSLSLAGRAPAWQLLAVVVAAAVLVFDFFVSPGWTPPPFSGLLRLLRRSRASEKQLGRPIGCFNSSCFYLSCCWLLLSFFALLFFASFFSLSSLCFFLLLR